MSGLAYHAQHFKSGSVGSVGKHNWEKRGKEDKHSNQDIDPSRSHLNFQPQPLDGTLYMAAKRRIQEACTGRVTAGSNWITETIVYPPEDVIARYRKSQDDAELRRYYADVLDWHKKEFGEDNVLAMTVHLDETTPHSHTDIVPLTEDGRLSTKEVFARKNLRRHHTELAEHLQSCGWDIRRGEDTRGKQIKSKTVSEYKREAEATRKEIGKELSALETKRDFAKQKTDEAVWQRRAAVKDLEATTAELEERRETSNQLGEEVAVREAMIAAYEERIGTLMDEEQDLTDRIEKKRKEAQKAAQELHNARETLEWVNNQIEVQTGVLERLRAAIDELRDTAAAKLLRAQERISETLRRISPAAADEFKRAFQAVKEGEQAREPQHRPKRKDEHVL